MGIATHETERRAFAGQPEGDRSADAPAGSGDDGELVLEGMHDGPGSGSTLGVIADRGNIARGIEGLPSDAGMPKTTSSILWPSCEAMGGPGFGSRRPCVGGTASRTPTPGPEPRRTRTI